MSLFRYSGLTTKVRAMSGALLSKEDFDQISTLGNVPEVVAWLKKKPSYGKVLGNENENTMHRGQAEGRIKRSFYADFSKLYRFSNMEQRNLYRRSCQTARHLRMFPIMRKPLRSIRHFR